MTTLPDPIRVLLVDDEPDIRLLQERLLSRHGFEVVGEAADGPDAVAAAQRLQPDVIVLDLMMPNPGDQALPHLLAVAPSSMIVICSAAADVAGNTERLLDAGAFSYIVKTDLLELPRLVAQAYDRFRAALDGESSLALCTDT